MSPARYLGGVTAALFALLIGWTQPAPGQRMQFPTAIPTNVAPSVSGGTTSGSTAGAPSTYGTSAPPFSAGEAPTYGTTPPPNYGSTPPSTYGSSPPPGYGSPLPPSYGSSPPQGYGTPLPNYTPPPAYGPNVAPGPGATFQGNIQPAPAWDPYGTPGSQPPTLLPTDPTLSGAPPYPEGTYAKMKRFLQEIRVDYVWMPGTGIEELGLNDLDFTSTFAIPFFHNLDTPLLVTPGFGLQLWNGPVTTLPDEFPARTYAAYLDTAWNPQVTPLLGAELGFRVGVYSDFSKLINESVRYTGHGLLVLSLSPSFQLKGGIVYLDRRRIKVLPAGGIVWTPNSDVRFEILFPNPKLAKRITTYGNTDWWLYVRGEYGGDSWTLRDEAGMPPVQVDYNDIRAGVGLEFDRFNGISGLFEVGIAFERELYGDGGVLFTPNNTVFLRGALAW